MLPLQLPRSAARPVCIFCRAFRPPNASFRRAYAARPAPRAPSTRAAQARQRARVMSEEERKRYVEPEKSGGSAFLPHINSLQQLKGAGLIKTEPQKVLELLVAFRDKGLRLDAKTAKALCDEHNVLLTDMPYVARACLNPQEPAPVRRLGKTILLTTSANEVPEATLYLLRAALKQDEDKPQAQKAFDSTELTYARAHLRKLVDAGDLNATVLQARVLETRGKLHEAIDILKKALANNATSPVKENSEEIHLRYAGNYLSDKAITAVESPWTTLARLELKVPNWKGAAHAFRVGAENDDPEAYEGLAGTFRDEERYNREWLEYITKAAASGVVFAARSLGHFYSLPLDKIPDAGLRKEMQHLEKYGGHVEWWYRPITESERLSMRRPPPAEPRPVTAIFWETKPDKQDFKMVVLDARRALAMEWYELVWRFFPDCIEPMHKILEAAAAEGRTAPSWGSEFRALLSEAWSKENLLIERIQLMLRDAKK